MKHAPQNIHKNFKTEVISNKKNIWINIIVSLMFTLYYNTITIANYTLATLSSKYLHLNNVHNNWHHVLTHHEVGRKLSTT